MQLTFLYNECTKRCQYIMVNSQGEASAINTICSKSNLIRLFDTHVTKHMQTHMSAGIEFKWAIYGSRTHVKNHLAIVTIQDIRDFIKVVATQTMCQCATANLLEAFQIISI